MASKSPSEEVITDQLTEEDWQIILSLPLNRVQKAYFQFFRDNSNRAMERTEIWRKLEEQGVIRSRKERLFTEQLSDLLKRRKVPYRIRGFPKTYHGPCLYRIVKVSPAQKTEET